MDQVSRSRWKWRWRRRFRWVVPTVAAIRTILVAIGAVLVIALEVPWLQAPLKSIGLDDLSGIGVAVIVFILALVFSDVRRLVNRQSATVEQYFPSPVTMFPVLLERVDQIKRDEDKVLEVIGVTLESAWPLVKF